MPQPTCDAFKYGSTNGYLDLFTGDSSYAKQWKYTDAPDADARAVQAAYWADVWAKAQGKGGDVSATVGKAAKMGDYLRYAMYDKYFKKIGTCVAVDLRGGTGKDASHYLLSWYYAWGGATDTSAGWAWRIGSSHVHGGYQNPLAAYALSSYADLRPKSSTGAADWGTSLTRQLEFYRWLQSNEGAIAGGATNSWAGRYATPPAGTPTFYGMYYDQQPVYHDPPSNQWFGFQAWSMERVAEYYQQTGNASAEGDPRQVVLLGAVQDHDQPGRHLPDPLHAPVVRRTRHLGSIDRRRQHRTSRDRRRLHQRRRCGRRVRQDPVVLRRQVRQLPGEDDGEGTPRRHVEQLPGQPGHRRPGDPRRLQPLRRHGLRPERLEREDADADTINSTSTFTSLRSFYKNDPNWSKIEAYLAGGAAPSFTYHRFWAQADIALAMGSYAELLE